MNELFIGLQYVRAYIEDISIINDSNFEDHVNKVKTVLKKPKSAGFKINADKLFQPNHCIEYLVFNITRQVPNKVKPIKDKVVPTNKKQLKKPIRWRAINYCRDM